MLGKRKLAAATKAVKKARKTTLAARRLPARREELKTVDTGVTNFATVSATTGNFQLLNGVDTGTDYTNRIGRKIIVKSILLRFGWFPLFTASDSSGEVVRIMIVCDEQPNGAAPAITDILQTANYLAPLNLNNRGRFKVLYDNTMGMPGWTASAGSLVNGSTRTVTGKIWKNLNLPVIFNGTGATISSIQTNSVYLVTLASEATTGMAFYSRVRFVDS